MNDVLADEYYGIGRNGDFLVHRGHDRVWTKGGKYILEQGKVADESDEETDVHDERVASSKPELVFLEGRLGILCG